MYVQPDESVWCCSCVYMFRVDFLELDNPQRPNP